MYPVLKIMHMLNFLDTFSVGITMSMYVMYCILLLAGGYVHRVSDLTVGVDLKQIRLMGILQVRFFAL